MLLTLGNLLAGMLLLFLGGDALVRGAVAASKRLGVSAMAAGLTIVAFGTSAPELLVSLRAATLGLGGLAVGNVVGSNICNVGLILGLALLIRPAAVDRHLIRNDIYIMIGAAGFLFLILLDGRLSRTDGAWLLAGIATYMAYLWRSAKFSRSSPDQEAPATPQSGTARLSIGIFLTVLGLLLLVLGGDRFVLGATGLAEAFGVAPAIIGLTVAAIGTSLPELATSSVAAVRGHSDLAIGNIVGSNIFNIFSILGFTAVIQPVSAAGVGRADLLVMLLASLLFLRFVFLRTRIIRIEGLLLLLGFSLYIAWLLA